MIAVSILIVLGVAVGALQFSLQSSHKQFYHAYYNEKALALIDGINAIARGKAQDRLHEIIEARGEAVDISQDVIQQAKALRLWDEGSRWEPAVEVSARIDPDKVVAFANSEPYQTIRELRNPDPSSLFSEGEEVEGIVEITSEVGFSTSGKAFSFVIPRRTVITEYEFKRILRVPQFFRQFALFVKDASVGGEDFQQFYDQTGFNRVMSDMKGYSRSGGALFVAPGGGLFGGSLPRADGNPFASSVGYVYLGGDDPMYLNLAAGDDDSEYSETFQLYQGATTNFYKVWGSDFTSFMEEAKKVEGGGGGGGGGGNFLSRAWSWVRSKVGGMIQNLRKMIEVLDQLDELEVQRRYPSVRSSGLPLYYVVRKDYGYALEWGEPRYARFGFGLEGGQRIFSSALHLYGVRNGSGFQTSGVGGNRDFGWSGQSLGATLVMGKVYRRCLSLAGYKQRRGQDDPSSGQNFEIQAGPVEYFEDLDALMKREQYPLKGAGAPPHDEKPIWVWDARVDWNRHEKAVNGTWLPISGPALLGRLLPSMGRFWAKQDASDAKKIFQASLMPPKEIMSGTTPDDVREAAEAASQVRNLQDFPDRIQGGVSPLLLTLSKKDFFSSGRSQLPWIDREGSPYFEELGRCFAYSSYLSPEELQEAVRSGDPATLDRAGQQTGQSFSESDVRDALLAGSNLWSQLKGDPSMQTMSAQAMVDAYPPSNPRGVSKGAFWIQDPSTDSQDADRYPFGLPDPWVKDVPQSSGSSVRPHPNNFQEAFEEVFGGKEEEVFDEYVRPIMTSPGRVLPYNYSMRFMFEELKELFGKPREERARLLSSEVAPEVREGIGFRVEGRNDYLELEDGAEGVKFDRALDDELLKKIFEARRSDEYLKKGFFFMDEYADGVGAPEEVDVQEPYQRGQRYCWEGLTQDEFQERFGPHGETPAGGVQTVHFGSAVRTSGSFDVFNQAPTMVRGGGVLLVPGTLKIGYSLTSDRPLTIVADRVVLGGDIDLVKAVIVAKEVEFSSASFVLEGALACEKWNADREPRSGRLLIAYDSKLKSSTSFVQVIEPRIHRMSIESGTDG